MLLIETILYALAFSLIWANLASLAMFSFERGHLFDFVREWIVAIALRLNIHKLRHKLGYDLDFEGVEEMQDYYNSAWDYLSMESKLIKLFICQICFTVHFGLWCSFFISFIYFSGTQAALFIACSTALNYFFSQKV